VLLGAFGAAAAVLALVGTFGLMAHAVRLRTAEIGIRMALGASPSQALSLLLRRGLALSGLGLALGIAGALALTRVLESFLWEVTTADPATFVAVPLALGGAAALACYTAARRALSIDPAAALRQGP
jgi:putative ABC transport system permease protein